MGKLSTKNINTEVTSSGLQKSITVGNQWLKINGLELKEDTYKPDAYYVMLYVETKPIENFEGWLINKDDPSMGSYEGQTGKIQSSYYSYKDSETKSGVPISRDQEILKFIKRLCTALGAEKWLSNNDEKYATIEDYIKGFNADQPFADKYLYFCVGGKEYTNKGGYKAHYLHLPDFTKNGVPFGPSESGVIEFNASKHIILPKDKNVKEFGGNQNNELGSQPEFQLD